MVNNHWLNNYEEYLAIVQFLGKWKESFNRLNNVIIQDKSGNYVCGIKKENIIVEDSKIYYFGELSVKGKQ